VNGKTTIVIPCYNEALRLDRGAFRSFMREQDVGFVFINDGSSDDTATVVDSICKESGGKAIALHLAENVGKGEAVRQGMRFAFQSGAEYAGFFDADLSTPLSTITLLQQVFHENPKVEMVFGARVLLLGKDVVRRRYRHLIGRFFATVASNILHLPVYDTQCGAKLLRSTDRVRKLFEQPFCSRWVFDVELIARFIVAGRECGAPAPRETIFEFPLPRWHHVGGSKISLLDFPRISCDLWKIWRRYGRRLR
jgi:glycosyltransferase involved in cell wall biosynthesis